MYNYNQCNCCTIQLRSTFNCNWEGFLMIDLRDRVLGCFIGKNVGGTLGMPFEGSVLRPGINFYTPVPEHPAANDDLDLQLVWLRLLEREHEVITFEKMAQAFLKDIDCHWDEYGAALRNLADGVVPGLSGIHNNYFTCGLGGAIRSEIWATVFAGKIPTAAYYAMLDSSIDHTGDGVYGEVFNAAVESAILSGADLSEALKIGKAILPADSQLKRLYDDLDVQWAKNGDFEALYNLVMQKYKSHNFTDVVMNGGFTYSALLAGNGDFEKTVLLAVNCAHDADCTAATAGAIIGSLIGARAIPARWKDAVNDRITVGSYIKADNLPQSVTELVDRVLVLQKHFSNVPDLPEINGVCQLQKYEDFSENRHFAVNNKSFTAADMRLPLSKLNLPQGRELHITTRITLPENVQQANLLVATRGMFVAKIDGAMAALKGDQSLPLPAPHRVLGGRIIPLPLYTGKREFDLDITIYPTVPIPDVYVNVYDWNNRHIKTEYKLIEQ
ncbi:MAG: ADP-ribosylglycohydrolase family protein [Lentisphaerae bacterium]|nr:ADP-ribosylglycohydrolase family protein [Lentisphaerota bacterium]